MTACFAVLQERASISDLRDRHDRGEICRALLCKREHHNQRDALLQPSSTRPPVRLMHPVEAIPGRIADMSRTARGDYPRLTGNNLHDAERSGASAQFDRPGGVGRNAHARVAAARELHIAREGVAAHKNESIRGEDLQRRPLCSPHQHLPRAHGDRPQTSIPRPRETAQKAAAHRGGHGMTRTGGVCFCRRGGLARMHGGAPARFIASTGA